MVFEVFANQTSASPVSPFSAQLLSSLIRAQALNDFDGHAPISIFDRTCDLRRCGSVLSASMHVGESMVATIDRLKGARQELRVVESLVPPHALGVMHTCTVLEARAGLCCLSGLSFRVLGLTVCSGS